MTLLPGTHPRARAGLMPGLCEVLVAAVRRAPHERSERAARSGEISDGFAASDHQRLVWPTGTFQNHVLAGITWCNWSLAVTFRDRL